MKKRALSIFLLSILVISCFLYVFPLNSLAETWFDNYSAWDIVSGYDNPSSHVYASESFVTKHYEYSSGTSWAELQYTVATSSYTQLPSPFYNLRNLTYNPGYRRSSSSIGEAGLSNMSFNFSGQLQDYVSALNLHDDDFFCFAQLFLISAELLDIHYTFGNIVTGNAFQPFASIDDKFLVYNNGVSGMTTSSIIDTNLWSSPSAGNCFVLAYFNILGSDLKNYSDLSSLNSIVVSLDFRSGTSFTLFSYKPVIYKTSLNGELQTVEYLSSIDDNIQIISDAVQSHVAPPTNYTDFSGVDQAEAQVSSKVNSIKNTLDDWALTSYISTGLSWVGAYTSYYFNEFGFIQAIYGIIVFFAIANVLRHGFFRTQRDYVTTDNYSVKGHNTQGDYEITGTRTTRRE